MFLLIIFQVRITQIHYSSINDSLSISSSDLLESIKITNNESEETTHYSIIDKFGNCVSVTTTLNGWFGSGITVDDSGFLLNNEMDDFSIKPDIQICMELLEVKKIQFILKNEC